MRKTKQLLVKFLAFMVVIFIIGIIGWLSPYGDAKWNFFFESLMFFPIELIITVFVINKLIEKVETEREFANYYDVAKESLEEIQANIKQNIAFGHTGKISVHRSDASKNFCELSENFDKYVNVEIFEKGIPVKRGEIFKGEIEFKDKRVFLEQHVAEHANALLKDLRNHISMYSKIIPIDINNELVKIVRFLEKSIIYSDGEVGVMFRDHLNQFREHKTFKDDDLMAIPMIYKQEFGKYQDLVLSFDKLINEKTS